MANEANATTPSLQDLLAASAQATSTARSNLPTTISHADTICRWPHQSVRVDQLFIFSAELLVALVKDRGLGEYLKGLEGGVEYVLCRTQVGSDKSRGVYSFLPRENPVIEICPETSKIKMKDATGTVSLHDTVGVKNGYARQLVNANKVTTPQAEALFGKRDPMPVQVFMDNLYPEYTPDFVDNPNDSQSWNYSGAADIEDSPAF